MNLSLGFPILKIGSFNRSTAIQKTWTLSRFGCAKREYVRKTYLPSNLRVVYSPPTLILASSSALTTSKVSHYSRTFPENDWAEVSWRVRCELNRAQKPDHEDLLASLHWRASIESSMLGPAWTSRALAWRAWCPGPTHHWRQALEVERKLGSARWTFKTHDSITSTGLVDGALQVGHMLALMRMSFCSCFCLLLVRLNGFAFPPTIVFN